MSRVGESHHADGQSHGRGRVTVWGESLRGPVRLGEYRTVAHDGYTSYLTTAAGENVRDILTGEPAENDFTSAALARDWLAGVHALPLLDVWEEPSAD